MRSFSSLLAGGPIAVVAVLLVLGLTLAAGSGPHFGRRARPVADFTGSTSLARESRSATSYSAEVLRVLDGDTFEARVETGLGRATTTRVRLRGIDAAEMRARCSREFTKALAARDALTKILAEGSVRISDVGPDKYPGRVDAYVSTRGTADVSAALLKARLVRSYDGGRRRSWCGWASWWG
jgi:endonuclease YncB( thermonuclease family)